MKLVRSSFLVTLLGLASAAAFAQGGPGGPDQVCLYEHANYGGWESCYSIGEGIPDLGPRRDRVSSVRIRGRAEVTLYEHPGFSGNQITLEQSIPDLRQFSRGWNDEVDSFRVSSGGGFRGGRGEQFRERRADRVCVYQHVGFQGNSQCWDAGTTIHDLREVGWNDGISSVRVFGDTRVALYEHNNFNGERFIVGEDIPDLTRVRAQDGGNWNDRVSSARVEGGGRRPGRR